MEETRTRAKLVDSPDVEAHGLAATISRKEIEEAFRADGEVELVLDIDRSLGENGGQRFEKRTVAIAWDRADLEKLLESTRSDDVTIAVDPGSLEEALEDDVEAHGLRERAVVLSVAAVTAVGAGGAMAALDEGGGAAQGAEPYAIEDVRAGQPAPEETSQAYAIEDVRAGQPAPEGTSEAYAIENVRAGQPAPEGTSEAYAIEDVRAGGTPTPAGDAYAVESVRGGRPAPVPESGEGITISAPSPAEAAGIAGAVALAITGAAFAVRGRRQPKPT